ncbi:MAG: hypothetical protein K2M57_04005 [Paramuribaculum sp.]|nr:hypothetical protein [Paramuribaculum sp.]
MYRFIIFLAVLSTAISLKAESYTYKFHDTPLSEALAKISEDHPNAKINFIFNEIECYRTSAEISADNALDAVRTAVGLNPVAVSQRDGTVYAEALQHGRYHYRGVVTTHDSSPIESATVMLLWPKDSVLLTYGMTDDQGQFLISCDRRNVIAKISSLGYRTRYIDLTSFDAGKIVMTELPIRLGEVKVEADEAYMLTDRTVYVPSQRQKNAATDATDLLRAMAIPQITVGATGEVNDNMGHEVKLFINSLPASPEEQEGLRTADVKRVEYLEYPADARFGGAEKVINFIVQEYEYGGYTKLTADESVLTGLQNYSNIFSKFAYKNVVINLYAGAMNKESRHGGSDRTSTFRLKDKQGKEYLLTTDETVEKSFNKSDSYPVTLQANYSSDKVTVTNTVGYTYTSYPINYYDGSLRYSTDPSRGYSYSSSNPTRSNSLAYSGYMYVSMPNGLSLNITPSFRYTHRNDRSIYSTSKEGTIIDRTAKEDSYSYSADFMLSKSFNENNSGYIQAMTFGDISNLDYYGTSEFNSEYSFISYWLNAGYSLRINRWSISMSASLSSARMKSNEKTNHRLNPYGRINVTFNPNSKNSFSTFINVSRRVYGIDRRTTELLRLNEFIYAMGNPEIKDSPQLDLDLDYTWLPSNIFYLSAGTWNFLQIRARKEDYEPYRGSDALLRTTFNNGRFQRSTIYARATLRLLGGKLQINVRPEQTFYRSTGINARSYSIFSSNTGVNLYLDRWYLSAYYYSPQNKMTEVQNVITKMRNLYWVTAGWSNGNLNLRFSAYNIFNKGWNLYDESLISSNYSYRSVSQSTFYHPRLNFEVNYTFGYGKKVNRGYEVGAQGSAASAIMK